MAKMFNEYCTGIAPGIELNDPISDDFDKINVLISLIRSGDYA